MFFLFRGDKKKPVKKRPKNIFPGKKNTEGTPDKRAVITEFVKVTYLRALYSVTDLRKLGYETCPH